MDANLLQVGGVERDEVDRVAALAHAQARPALGARHVDARHVAEEPVASLQGPGDGRLIASGAEKRPDGVLDLLFLEDRPDFGRRRRGHELDLDLRFDGRRAQRGDEDGRKDEGAYDSGSGSS